MELLNLIKSRRSIMPAQFNNLSIDDNDINLILEAANWAPTHKKTEPWRFKVIRDKFKVKFGNFLAKKYKEKTLKFSNYKYNRILNKVEKSAVIILICMQRDPLESVPEWEEIAAVSMSVQNMWLMSTKLNIGSYWSSPKLINYMDEFIEFKEGERCLGIYYMGHYDKNINSRIPSSIDDKISWYS
tara:strand:- start:1689 stop:2246 length:558 start_codon:yes stop_codon:yes gene_type:complete